MQCRVNDLTVNNVPKFLTHHPNEYTHSNILQSPDDAKFSICLPLTSYLHVRSLTHDEWDTGDITWIDMTSKHLDWDPNNSKYSLQEERMADFWGILVACPDMGPAFVITLLPSLMTIVADMTDDKTLPSHLNSMWVTALPHST
jgi:hypothetical protein